MEKKKIILRAFARNIKSGIFAIGVCVLMISLLMNLFFLLSIDYRENFSRTHTALNAEHVSFIGSYPDVAAFQTQAEAILAANATVSEYETVAVYNEWGSCDYNGEKAESYYCFVAESVACARRIGKVEILEEDASICGVLLPYQFEKSNNYAVGDAFTLTNGTKTMTLPVAGFFSNAMSATPNCGYVTVLYSDGAEAEVQAYFGSEKLLFGIRLNRVEDNTTAEMALSDEIVKKIPGARIEITNKYNTVFAGRFVVETVSMAIIGGLVVLMTVLTVFIIASGISSYIFDNKAMFGILETVGYSGRQIVWTVFPAAVAAVFVVTLVGIALTYPVFPLYNNILEAQTGLPYALSFRFLPALWTVVLMLLSITAALALSFGKIAAITPLDAIVTKRKSAPGVFRRITVKDLPLPLNWAIAVQNSFSKIGESLLVFVVLFAVSFLCVFGTALLRNIVVNDAAIAEFMLGEYADTTVIVLNRDSEAFCRSMEENAEVENCVGYFVTAAGSPEKEYLSAIVVDRPERLTNRAYCYAGRLPSGSGEAAIAGKYAREHGVAIGDALTVTLSGKEVTLTVCGLLQNAKYLGCDVLLTKECYETAVTPLVYQYYITLAPGVDVETFNHALSASFSLLFSSNMQSNLRGLEVTYFTGIKAICKIMIAIGLVTVTLVLYVLVKNLLEHKKYDYGVMLTIGYLPKTLILQSGMTYLPTAFAATALGAVSSAFAFNPLMSMMLRGIGIERCNFEIPWTWVLAVVVGIVLLSFGLAVLFSQKIRKTKAFGLIRNEE